MKAVLTLEFEDANELVDYVSRLGQPVEKTEPKKEAPVATMAAAVNKPTTTTAPVKKEEPPKQDPPPQQEDEDLGGEAPISYETLWANVDTKIQAGHRETIKAELGRLGVKKVSELKPEQFSAFNTFVNAIG